MPSRPLDDPSHLESGVRVCATLARRDDACWVCWTPGTGIRRTMAGLTHLNQGAAPNCLLGQCPPVASGTASRPHRTVDQVGRSSRPIRSPSDGEIQYHAIQYNSVQYRTPWHDTVHILQLYGHRKTAMAQRPPVRLKSYRTDRLKKRSCICWRACRVGVLAHHHSLCLIYYYYCC